MVIYLRKRKRLSDGSTTMRGDTVGSVALEPPSAGESTLITPKPTGHGGVIIPCFSKKDSGAGEEAYAVELTRRDLLALCEAAQLFPQALQEYLDAISKEAQP